MFLIDFTQGCIVEDSQIKQTVGTRFPYRSWLDSNLVPLSTLAPPQPYTGTLQGEQLMSMLRCFGYSNETVSILLVPMVTTSKEALGSMGNDGALACLSSLPKLTFDYFKQLFAQVTNPPIDSIRESMVMSLQCPVGPEANLLERTPEQCRRLLLPGPLLLPHELAAIRDTPPHGWKTTVLDTTVPTGTSFIHGIVAVADAAKAAVSAGTAVLILSDKMIKPGRVALPALCVAGAVHHGLVANAQRTQCALLLESGESH